VCRYLLSQCDASTPDAERKMTMATYRLPLYFTYFSQGFFNVPVDYDRFVPRADTVPIQLGSDGPTVKGTINWRANRNGTARIRGRGLARWFGNNFKVGDIVEVVFSIGDRIVLKRPGA
jgi:hypothetical protein